MIQVFAVYNPKPNTTDLNKFSGKGTVLKGSGSRLRWPHPLLPNCRWKGSNPFTTATPKLGMW